MVDKVKILCIGTSLLEKTCVVNVPITEGVKLKLDNKTETGSGHAGNIAYLLSKWGVETYIASMLGADDAADKIKKEYETVGTKTEFMETSYDKPTGESLVVVNETTKNHSKFEMSSNAVLKKFSCNFEPDVIVTDGDDFNASVAALDKYPKAKTFLVASTSNNEVNELARFVKNVIFNKEIAEFITNIKIDYNDSNTLVNVYNKLKQKYGNAEIIVTLGERGCIYAINGQIKIMPPVVVSIVDTNGAGDAFAGGYVYGMARDFGLEKSIAFATIAASFSTTKLTARESFPTLTEVSSYYDSKFGAQNNPNNTPDATPNTTAMNNASPAPTEHTTLNTEEPAQAPTQATPETPNAVDNNANK